VVFSKELCLDKCTHLQITGASGRHVTEYIIDFSQRSLIDASGQEVRLRPQAFEVLSHLTLNAGKLVTKEELLAHVWPDVVVTDDSLVQAVGDVRRALGDDAHQVLKTVPRRGYILVSNAVYPAQSTRPGKTIITWPLSTRHSMGLVLSTALVLAMATTYLWLRESRYSAGVENVDLMTSPSIAVLAFKGQPQDAVSHVIAREVAADLVAELARSPDLRVVSTQSSFPLSESNLNLTEIGQLLRSRYIVDGTVRRDKEQLHIRIELLDSEGGHVVWTSAHTANRITLVNTQQAIVSRIAGTLQSKVSRTEERRVIMQSPKALDVYVLTAQGKAMMHRYSAYGMRESRRFYQQALAMDPNYAPALVFLGMTDTIDIGLNLTGEWDESRLGEVLDLLQHVIALQPDLPIAYVALSQAQALAGNFEAALYAAEQSCNLSPNDADCFYILGKAQLETGQVEKAVVNLEQALDRNPVPPAFLPAFYATALWGSGQLQKALRTTDECLVKAPDFWRCRQDRIAILIELGRVDEARAEGVRLLQRHPRMTTRQFGSAFADSAIELVERRVNAAKLAGIPVTSH
jgi:DNA-binding winged helix-turn-helix (wHTH) protein/TolB-like protein/tetratricopeptide (TPR) repeat protein